MDPINYSTHMLMQFVYMYSYTGYSRILDLAASIGEGVV